MTDWDDLTGLEEEWEGLLGARQRRIRWLREKIRTSVYWRPAERIAEGILFGRPRWGEALINEDGSRKDET